MGSGRVTTTTRPRGPSPAPGGDHEGRHHGQGHEEPTDHGSARRQRGPALETPGRGVGHPDREGVAAADWGTVPLGPDLARGRASFLRSADLHAGFVLRREHSWCRATYENFDHQFNMTSDTM